jgi:hypothetical protein
MFRLSRAVCAFLLSFSSIGAMAADEKSGEIWVNAGSISHHFNRNYDFNERNWGLGAEYKFDARRSVFAGTYRNSMWRTTRYAGLSYTPFQIGQARIGMIGGVADGYREMNDGGFFPMISPVLSIEGKRFGMNFIVIPSIVSNVSSALALQVKIRIGS